MRYSKFLASLVLLGALFWAVVIFANSHIRSDTITGAFGLNSEICVGGDQTAHYTNGRYITVPETEPNRSFFVESSSFLADPPLLGCNALNNQTYIRLVELPSGDNVIVCLWSSNPLPTYDCRDTTPPTISNISAGSITQTSATITWTTNENADSKVDYGTTTNYGSTKSSSTLTTSHSLAL